MQVLIDNLIYPKIIFLFGFVTLVFVDLITGIRKASKNGIATTSQGMRRTINKMSNYLSVILMMLVLVNLGNIAPGVHGYTFAFNVTINFIIVACIYIECKSIVENLIELNTFDGIPNDFCYYILIPLHKILILNLKNILR